MMMSITTMIEAIEQASRDAKKALNFEPANKFGLDDRAGYMAYDGDAQCLIVDGSTRSLEYYGGFQYVDRDCVDTYGDLTVYNLDENGHREPCRVQECLTHYEEHSNWPEPDAAA
jgi:hypothetical protein